MSWGDLVKNNLVGTGFVSKAAICGADGQIWGISEGFQLNEQEALATSKAFNNPDTLHSTGLSFEGEKYIVLQADGERVIGKKASKGFFMYKTPTTVIISLYQEGVQPEMCSKVTGALADYFKQQGY